MCAFVCVCVRACVFVCVCEKVSVQAEQKTAQALAQHTCNNLNIQTQKLDTKILCPLPNLEANLTCRLIEYKKQRQDHIKKKNKDKHPNSRK